MVKWVLMQIFQLAELGFICFTMLAAIAILTDWMNKK